MERPPVAAPPPAFLPVGTVVGPWRVVAWAGQGVYGAVYRAVRVGQEDAEPVALKVALLPRDPRFPREGELLSRVSHPSIPRLIDAGEWQHPGGTRHPYIAMEWIDGVPLYDWAREHHPTSQEVLRFMAQLASALQALHSQGALHRDLKGDNVLVRRTDNSAVLMDFGSGSYVGAASLTPQQLPPGTPAYRSPEAWLFELRFSREPTARYRAASADDLYALGVTACRLVTGEYPELGAPQQDDAGIWQLDTVVPPAALLQSPRVDPPLRSFILRLLSVRPEERGTTQELAEALGRAADPGLLPEARVEVHAPTAQESAARTRSDSAAAVRRRAHAHFGRRWLAVTAVGLVLAAAVWWLAPGQPGEGPAAERAERVETHQPDAGTVGLGDSAETASLEDSPAPSVPEGLTEDALPKPQPGQARPDAKGRCPRKGLVALNGACWVQGSLDSDGCAAIEGQLLKDICYIPFIPRGRTPTSDP